MKKVLSIILFILLVNFLSAQEKKFYELAQQQEASYANLLEYTDPGFPATTKSSDPSSDIEYINKLEEYAKLHPPCPILRHTGNEEQDKLQWANGISKWKQMNSFFPRYIPYHLFNKLLSQNDDLLFYEAAIKVWLNKNADKYLEKNNSNE